MASTDAPAPAARTRTRTTRLPALARAALPWRPRQSGPGWARPALLAVLAVAAALFTWDIQHSTYHPFYSETVRSMSESWKGFLYGSFDPGNSITIDKLPGFMWPQALSARIFGFHPWALTLPQVVEGVLSVAVLYRAVRRWAGAAAGLLAATAFTVTPTVTGLFRTQVEDPAFTLLVLLAADAVLRAVGEGRPRSLVHGGVWVGLAFQAKMLEAWAVLPALGLVYAVAAPAALRRRLAHLATAFAVCVAVSASWVLLVAATPAHDRPYVDGTTDNSPVSQVVGYNFLNRFSSLPVSPRRTGSVASSSMAGTAPAPPGHSQAPADDWAKLLRKPLASQTGWLYPAAAVSAVCGLAWRRRRPRVDPVRAGFLLWSVWFATFVVVFSAGAVGTHLYYMGVVAVPVAALFGGGTVHLWRGWRSGSRRRAWALPTALMTTVGWSAFTAARFPSFLPWLAPTAAVLGLGATALLVRSRSGALGPRHRTAAVGLAVGLAAMLLPSAAWASSVLDGRYGHSGMGAAGPLSITDITGHHGKRHRAGGPAAVVTPGAPRRPTAVAWPVTGYGLPRALSPDQRHLLAYTRADRDGAAYLFATTSWRMASPFILYTGAPVMPMGGFTGAAPSPSTGRLRQLVTTGKLRYVLLGGPATSVGHANAIWVRAHCSRTTFRPEALYLCSPSAAARRPAERWSSDGGRGEQPGVNSR